MTLLSLLIVYSLVLSFLLWRRGYRGNASQPETPAPTVSNSSTVKPARVLIVGATGGTGRELVSQALDRGLTVTAFVRDPSRITMNHPKLTVVRGDVMDEGSLATAIEGHDAVLSALGHRRYYSPAGVLSRGTANILRTMEVHGVRRFVCETSLGIGDSAGRMGLYYTFFVIPLVLPVYFWDKALQERTIAESNAEWVIVRPGALTNGRKRGRVRHGRGVGSFLRTVSVPRADVAEFMLDQLTSNAYLRAAARVA